MPGTGATNEIVLRPIRPEDMNFLSHLYASTREVELAPVPWSREQKEAFLRFQFEAQHKHYVEHYPGASFDVVLANGEPAGRLYQVEWDREIRLIDVALLPEFRGHGIGSRLLAGVLARGREVGKAVTIHVEQNNPAMRLYRRLGFEKIGEHGIYHLMEWRPEEMGAAGDEDQVNTAS
ncbi:MAG TPA: N-acetyltransferase [Thermoanaerobaculia bacterium]|nr:N-acetyltransferase [Thermoanaerobaculia bacterium]